MQLKRTVVLVHGWGGTHQLHWQAWLKNELEKKGIKVFFPRLPTPDLPVEKEWVQKIIETVKEFDESIILVGHSLGCPTILRVLEKIPLGSKIRAAVLVSGFANDLGIPEIANFVEQPFDWKKIKNACKKFAVVYSDNDPFIPVSESLFLAKKLGAETVLEKNGRHITAPDYGAWPEILEIAWGELK